MNDQSRTLTGITDAIALNIHNATQKYVGMPNDENLRRQLRGQIVNTLRGYVENGIIPNEINVNCADVRTDPKDRTRIIFDLPTKLLVYLEDGWPSLHKHFQHPACENCTFLVHYKGRDLYHCTQGGRIPTVIARHSSEPPDYESGIFSASQMEEDAPLRVALRISSEEGLPVEPPKTHADQ